MGDPINCVISFAVPCGVVISCAACCITCCCYCARNIASNTQTQVVADDTAVTSQPQRRYSTLKKRMVVQFRAIWASVHSKTDETALPDKTQLEKVDCKENCIICWEGYNNKEEEELVGVVKKCGHYFHFDCLWTWLEQQDSCPLCRESTGLSENDITGIPLKCIPQFVSAEDKEKDDAKDETKTDVTSENKELSKENAENCNESDYSSSDSVENKDVAFKAEDKGTGESKAENTDAGESAIVIPERCVARAFSQGRNTPNSRHVTTDMDVHDNPCFDGSEQL